MNLEITPQPDDAERTAIEAALEAEAREAEQAGLSPWAKSVLPVHDAQSDAQHP